MIIFLNTVDVRLIDGHVISDLISRYMDTMLYVVVDFFAHNVTTTDQRTECYTFGSAQMFYVSFGKRSAVTCYSI